jgi:two-component system, NtrC family, sensor kinase
MSAGVELREFVVDHLQIGIFVLDRSSNVVLWNAFMAAHSGRSAQEVVGKNLFTLFPELPHAWLEKKLHAVISLGYMAFTSWEQRPYLFRFRDSRPVSGGLESMRQSCTFLPIKDERGDVQHVCVTLADYTDVALYQDKLRAAIAELEAEKAEQAALLDKIEEVHTQLLQSEKLASIGQLAAGVAHEINNPIGFVYSNFGTLENYLREMFALLDAYAALDQTPSAAALENARKLRDQIDLEYLRRDTMELLSESRDGITRVKKIVQDLKDFSHQGKNDEWTWSHPHAGLDTTLNIVNNEIKYKAKVVKDYGPIPEIQCLPSQLNQVFMNLLVNAAHAIEHSGTITVSTRASGSDVVIEIADDGCGISEENLKRIFDPFFTTKPVGKGTGLGLALSYSIIQKHNGHIEVDSKPGSGTTFRVFLPKQQPQQAAQIAGGVK